MSGRDFTPRIQEPITNLGDYRRNRRHPINVPRFEPEWLHQALEPVKKDFLKSNTPEGKLVELSGIGGKQVSGGGRRAVLNGVRTDDRAIGWARLEGGGESCAFCKMLISRGAAYKSAGSAGLGGPEARQESLLAEWQRTNDDSVISGMMNKWHPNCDCIVVPVFSKSFWPGKDKFEEYQDDWYEAQRWAKRMTGKPTYGKEKYRAFRRYLYAKDAPASLVA